MKLYYSIADRYPAFRVDLSELFALELMALGLETTWFMDSGKANSVETAYARQKVYQPKAFGLRVRILNKIIYWVTDACLLLSIFFRKYDAVQCRDKYIASLVGIFVAKIKGIPFIYWCSYPFPEHDATAADLKTGIFKLLGKGKSLIRFYFLYKFICPLSDHIFVQSQKMKQDMNQYGIPNNKMTPVPMGVPNRILEWAKKNNTTVIPNRIVYVGTLTAVRKLDMIIDAFHIVLQKFPAAELMIIGEGDFPSEREFLEKKVSDLGIKERVRFTGFVPMEKAWEYAASASICLSPFFPTKVLASTSPTKLVEYLALGRPVVCNNHPEQTEIINQSQAGICVEWSPHAFSHAICKLLEDPQKAEANAANGPSWVIKNRIYPIIAATVWEKYNELLMVGRYER